MNQSIDIRTSKKKKRKTLLDKTIKIRLEKQSLKISINSSILNSKNEINFKSDDKSDFKTCKTPTNNSNPDEPN